MLFCVQYIFINAYGHPCKLYVSHIQSNIRQYFFTCRIVMPRPLGGGIKHWCCLTSDVCLLRTSGLSREQRGLERLKLAKRQPTSHMTQTTLLRSKGQRSRSRGQWILRRKMCHIFVADKATLFKCRTLTDCGQFLFTDCKLSPKSAWPGWRDVVTQFRNFATLSIFRKRLTLRFSNLVRPDLVVD